jgi:two-component system, chemotaxis family, sensor kinase CheA
MSDFDGMEDIVREFLVESHENLDRLDQEFITWEANPNDAETLGSIFRTIHTIKGTSGFFGFTKLEQLAHAGENLLSLLRDKKLTLDPDMTSSLLSMVDAVRTMLTAIEADGNDGDMDYASLRSTLRFLSEEQKAPPAVPSVGEIFVEDGHVSEEQVVAAVDEQKKGDPRHLGEILVDQGDVQPAVVKEVLEKQNVKSARESQIADATLRVDVEHLDRLMNLAGELVLVRNQLLQYSERSDDNVFAPVFQRLNMITTELQEGVMKTRMQPIGNVWNKFPRVVRDLSLSCGKQIRLEMDGKDTELDKTLLEAIKDPLTHIVRNSVDHGVESPEDRLASGKPEEGVIRLAAYHESGQVNIEISDDGGGINIEAVRKKAIERGVISAEDATSMSDRELANLIFQPGFSTAKTVTKVSGRGVGMDVVKTNISRIGGMVDLTNHPGKGSTIRIKIPLTLAIVPALVVRCKEQRFAVPQVSLLELVRLDGTNDKQSIEWIHGAPVYRLRDRLLPLLYLREQLSLEQIEKGYTNIVVLQAGDHSFGLVVDEITDTEEIVVKPLGEHLKDIPFYAGATIMGDGSVALILDVMGIAQGAGFLDNETHAAMNASLDKAKSDATDNEIMLVFQVGGSRMAVPLDQVDRLEEVESNMVENTGQQDVIQYRGQILPLIRPEEHLAERRTSKRDTDEDGATTLQVVVYSCQGKSFGLVVDQIIDIASEKVEVHREATREGVLSVKVVQEKITEMLDIERLAQIAG